MAGALEGHPEGPRELLQGSCLVGIFGSLRRLPNGTKATRNKLNA